MSRGITNTSIRWAAELSHVREVSLLGTADLAYWKDRLLGEELQPAENDGRAQLLIIGTDSKYMGVRFRELSFSVLVSRPNTGSPRDAAYLIRAFNSCRLFAFSERVLFSTPYYYGDVRVSRALPAFMRVVQKGTVGFAAEMGGDASGPRREPSRCGEDGWEGAVFLPATRRGACRHRKVFIARLRGYTQSYPFIPATDSITIEPYPGGDFLQALRDSRFCAKEWIVREDAQHAKSKTYKRAEAFACLAPTADAGV